MATEILVMSCVASLAASGAVAEWPMSERARRNLEHFEFTDTVAECIGEPSDWIKDYEALDPYRILFETQHNYYLGEILGPRKCQGMGNNNPIFFEDNGDPDFAHCKGDVVTVERDGMMVGRCKLGGFRLLKKKPR